MLSDAMYTLGQIARVIYPDSSVDIPAATLDTLLARPASGLALLARRPLPAAAAELAARLPAGLCDPAGGVSTEIQGRFWLGYYQYKPAQPPEGNEAIRLLRQAGAVLYGDRWQSELSRLLDVGDRRVREWISGARSVPPGVWPEVAAALKQRGLEANAVADAVQKAIN